jgi:hypothetical protein
MRNEPDQLAYSQRYVGKLIGLSPDGIGKAISEGRIPGVQVGQVRRVPGWWVREQKALLQADADSGVSEKTKQRIREELIEQLESGQVPLPDDLRERLLNIVLSR